MANLNPRNEVIELSLPANAAYVSAARLTASSVANRMGFSIDEIEDVKAAVSEACTFIIRTIPASGAEHFKVSFEMDGSTLITRIHIQNFVLPEASDTDEMGLIMIRALVDEFWIVNQPDGCSQLEMVKIHRQMSFD